ncbi:zinc finger BED domain-containing protein 1 [Elysia marginata]|uniref:Zinc finger BED domain-containing protein 1 n=1 Tax=Elysia marginata TaxID=1093978 RepID=A0AAV4H4W6_9GAST|nr:zinc finger BED domain-containing protein 1 [Elysia marginata]
MRKHIEMKHPDEMNRAVVNDERSNRKDEVLTIPSKSLSSTIIKQDPHEQEHVNDSGNDNDGFYWVSKKGSKGSMTQSGLKRKNASMIWEFVVRVGPTELKCQLCQKHFSFDGSTSNMHRHVRRDHPKELAEVMEGGGMKTFSFSTEPAGANEGPPSSSEVVSSVAEGYISNTTDSLQTSFSPNNPQTQITYSSKRHGKVRKRTDWGFKRKNASIIWQFVAKINEHEVRCLLCSKVFRLQGSTSNMLKHVQKEHPEEFAQAAQRGGTITLPSIPTENEHTHVRNEATADERSEISQNFSDEEDILSGADPDYTSEFIANRSEEKRSHAQRPVLARARLKMGNFRQGRIMKNKLRFGMKRKNQSIIWRFMIRLDPSGTMCQLCKKPFTYEGSTSNMIKHLKKEHPEELAVVMGGGNISLPPASEADVAFMTNPDTFSVESDQFVESKSSYIRSHAKDHYFRKKPTSLIWRFMNRMSFDKVNCQICSKEFNYVGSTSNMRKHVKLVHPAEYSKVLSSGGTLAWPSQSHAASSFKVTPNTRTESRGLDLDKLVFMAVGNLYPYSLDLAESEGFIKFMHAFNPRFIIPEKKFMEIRILDLHRKHAHLLQNELEKALSVSISTDIWTYRERQKYLTVTGHFVSDTWELRSSVLKTVLLDSFSDFSSNIADKLQKVLEEYNILEKVNCIVGDSTDQLSAAVTRMNKPYLHCVAHSLNRIVQESLKASSHIKSLVKRVRDVASFFIHSTEASEKLSQIQSSEDNVPLKFVLHAEPDWIGNIEMLECYLKLHNTLQQVLTDINKEKVLLVAEELETVNHCVQVLEPFAFAAKDMVSDSFTGLSKSLPVFEILHQMTENLAHKDQATQGQSVPQSESTRAFMKTITELTDKCFNTLGDRANFLPWAATLLDPRFKHMVIEDLSVFKWVETELQKLMGPKDVTVDREPQTISKSTDTDTNTTSLLWSSFDETIKRSALEEPVDELQRYVEERPISRQENPLEWWMDREHLYPKLCKIVKRFLCIPATAVPAKKFFSEKEKMRKSLRNFLEEPQIDAVLFLNSCQGGKSKDLNQQILKS